MGQGREAGCAKLLAAHATAAGRGTLPSELVQHRAWAPDTLTLGRAVSFSCQGGTGGSWRDPGEPGPAAPPPPAPRLAAELTLDKQLRAIYLGPYGAGEQVCGNEEPRSH